MRFKTESGSEYEIVNHPSGSVIRRLNADYGKRADGEWIRLLNAPDIRVGESAVLLLESLSKYGEDDYGHSGVDTGSTVRQTSTVVAVDD